MDKLPKKIYSDNTLLYQYRGLVPVPPLEMIDDILTFQKCGATSLVINNEVNPFIEKKKLQLSQEKCVKIYAGKKCNMCEQIICS